MKTKLISVQTLAHFAIYAGIYLIFENNALVQSLVLAACLIWISLVDWNTYEIPDRASALLALSGAWYAAHTQYADRLDFLIGGIFWPLMFWLVAKLHQARRGYQGLGFGDVKLMCGIGLWCGLVGTVYVILSASIAGILVMLMTRKSYERLQQQAVAFGPFLCLCTWCIWLSRN